MNLGKSRLFALAAAHGASLLAVPAVLQAAPADGALEEIVVTARQREERIENVPVSITAFTAADIRSAGIDRPQDFIALTPGMAQVQTAEVGDLQVTIRGINTGRDAEPNFALVIDGVLQTNPNALNQELANVTQIEVLKGPQGAVYGRNALAGALIVTTRKPGDEWERDLRAGFGSHDSYNGNFYAGGPLSDSVKGSFSAYTRKTDGQWRNIKLDCEDCVDYFEETGVSGRLLFDLAGGEMDFRAKYSELDAGAINFNGSIALADVAPFVGPAFYEDPNKHNFRYINNVEPRNEQENVNLSLKGDWDVGIGTLTSYLAYNDQTNYFLTDGTSDAFLLYAFNLPANNSEAAATCQQTNDDNLTVPGYEAPFFGLPSSLWFTPGPPANGAAGFLPPYGPSTCGGYQYQQRDQEDLSFELRLTSPGDQRLRWLGGVYFADIQRDVVVSQGSDLGGNLRARPFVPADGPNPTDLLYDDTFDSTVYAVFGQLAYDVIDNLEVALALRFDSEDREVSNNVPVCTTTDLTSCRAQTFGFNFYTNPYINPAYTANPDFATSGIPDRSRTFEQLAAEDLGELEVAGGPLAVRVLRLRVPQRRLQLLGQRRHDRAGLPGPERRHDAAVPRRFVRAADLRAGLGAEHHGRERHVRQGSVEGGRSRREGVLPRSLAERQRSAVPHRPRGHAVLQLLRRSVRPAARRDEHRRSHAAGGRGRLPLARERHDQRVRRLRVHGRRDRQVHRPALHGGR